MRALVQRVTNASVKVGEEITGKIDEGLCVLVGVTHNDDKSKAVKLAGKLWNLRIFEDEAGQMNKSAADFGHSLLIVSQFTLYGDTAKGRRPSFVDAARPEVAEPLIEDVIGALQELGAHVESGQFRTEMAVSLTNDGPVTLMIEV